MLQANEPPLPQTACVFLDVDGTLLELTDTPFATYADDDLKSLLGRVALRLHGALALVSGRSIEYLDALFAPLNLPIAGLHGVERRSASGKLERGGIDPSHLDRARATLGALVAGHPGTLLEDKGRTVAVHFRLAPHAEAVVRQSVTGILGQLGAGYHAQDGNMMIEIKPRGFSKGAAIGAFMREAPFAGRVPVFLGDDLTDLDGFSVVESHGGISIGVGERVKGKYQLEGPTAVRAWLARIANS
jgi:trehalose 6-phosphate phosphatase